jgi:hypothetical protein
VHEVGIVCHGVRSAYHGVESACHGVGITCHGVRTIVKNVEALYLHKNSPQYEWSWDLGGLVKNVEAL